MSLLDYTAVELAAKIKAGETTATEAMEAVIAQIENLKMSLTVMLHLTRKKLLQQLRKQMRISRQVSLQDLWPEYHLQSKIICVQRACLLHAHLRYLVISFQLTQQTL